MTKNELNKDLKSLVFKLPTKVPWIPDEYVDQHPAALALEKMLHLPEAMSMFTLCSFKQ